MKASPTSLLVENGFPQVYQIETKKVDSSAFSWDWFMSTSIQASTVKACSHEHEIVNETSNVGDVTWTPLLQQTTVVWSLVMIKHCLV